MNFDSSPQQHVQGSRAIFLPEKPEEPGQSDCCGSGCNPCVFDIYEQELKIWERECKKLLQANNQELCARKLSPEEYTKFEIQKVETEAEDCIKVKFRLPDGMSLGLHVGQHVIMRSWSENKSVTRQYTPVSPLDDFGYFDLIMRIYTSGKMSQIARHWKAGDSIEFRGPVGEFVYQRNQYKKMLCLAAGTGIAPMIQVIRSVLDDEDDETMVQLLYSVKKYSQILMKPLLDEWAGYWNFTCTYFLSQDKEEDNSTHRYGDIIHFCPISKGIVLSKLDGDQQNTLVLICGNVAYDSSMLSIVRQAEIPESNIHKF